MVCREGIHGIGTKRLRSVTACVAEGSTPTDTGGLTQYQTITNRLFQTT